MKKFFRVGLLTILATTLSYTHSFSRTTAVIKKTYDVKELNIDNKQPTLLQITSSGALRINSR